VSNVHLLRGENESLLADAVSDFVRRLVADQERALVVEEFDGEEYELPAVVAAAQTPPLLTDRRVVVARGLQRFGPAEVEALTAALADLPATTDLVLTATGRIAKKVLDAVTGVGGITTVTDAPAGGRDRRQWLDEQMNDAPVRLDPAARAAIAEQLGEDLGRLPGLLGTLAAAYGPDAKVDLDDVEPFLGEPGSVPPWELTDAIDRGDTAGALDRLERMLNAGERHPLVVMATLHNHYARMLRLDGSGVADDRGAAALLGVKSPFQARKALDMARRLEPEGIARAITLLADADLDLRGAKDWPENLVVEVLVARLSRLTPARRTPAARR